MRFNLVRFGPREYRFLWTFHHALLDGRSFPIVLKEVFAFYEAALRVESIELPAPRPFRDHIAWLGQKDFEPSQSYWNTALRGFSHPTAFGIDRNRSRADEEDGGRG